MFRDNRSSIFDSFAFVCFRCFSSFIFVLLKLDLIISISTGGTFLLRCLFRIFSIIVDIQILIKSVDHLLDSFIVLFLYENIRNMRMLIILKTWKKHVEPLMNSSYGIRASPDSIFETGIKTYILTIKSCLDHLSFGGTLTFALI